MIHESSSCRVSQVIDQNALLTGITIPPLVTELHICFRVLRMSFECLAATWLSIPPETRFWSVSLWNHHMHTMDFLYLEYAPNTNVSRDVFILASLCESPNLLPVLLVVALLRLDTILPWTCHPSLLLHAIVMSTIIDLNRLKVRFTAYFLQP